MDIRLDQDWRMRPIKATPGKPISGSRTTTKSLSNEIRPRCLRHSLRGHCTQTRLDETDGKWRYALRTRMAGWTGLRSR